MAKNLIKEVDLIIKNNNYDMTQYLKCMDIIQMRIDWLEMHEPDSCGSVYDAWEEKCEELRDLLQEFIDMKNNIEKDLYDSLEETIEDIKDTILNVKTYQIMYGGLKRIELY